MCFIGQHLVKPCSVLDCPHIVPVCEKRLCPTHNCSLVKTDECPVQFVYNYLSGGQ